MIIIVAVMRVGVLFTRRRHSGQNVTSCAGSLKLKRLTEECLAGTVFDVCLLPVKYCLYSAVRYS